MTPLEAALVEEAARKSGLVWVRGPEGPARPLWHVWLDGAVCLVGDGSLEQPLTGMGLADGATASVSVRSKDKGGRLVAWQARVVELAPHGERWEAAVGELRGKRLNAPDAPRIAERWARESRVLRLEPADAPVHTAGTMPDDAHTAAPVPTPATTRSPAPRALPRLLRRRRHAG
jgi:hypothetical protein